MRELILVRHGKAAESAAGGDPARELTAEGSEAIRGVGRGLRALSLVPDAIWHSPYVRAEQTARLLAAALGCSALVAKGMLAPMTSGETAAHAVRDASERRLLCVSHLPLLPELAGELVGARLDFGTGTAAHIGIVGPHATTLLALWSADQLARVR